MVLFKSELKLCFPTLALVERKLASGATFRPTSARIGKSSISIFSFLFSGVWEALGVVGK